MNSIGTFLWNWLCNHWIELLGLTVAVLLIVIPMRRKLLFYKRYFETTRGLLAVQHSFVHEGSIEEGYKSIVKYVGDTRSTRFTTLLYNLHAVVDHHLKGVLGQCVRYQEILMVDQSIERLMSTVHYPRNVSLDLELRLVACIQKFVDQNASQYPSEEFFKELQVIKKEIGNLIRSKSIANNFNSWENTCLEKLLASLKTSSEMGIKTAVVTADFISTVSVQDHNEIVTKIQNIIAPVLKKNPNATLVEKYDWCSVE